MNILPGVRRAAAHCRLSCRRRCCSRCGRWLSSFVGSLAHFSRKLCGQRHFIKSASRKPRGSTAMQTVWFVQNWDVQTTSRSAFKLPIPCLGCLFCWTVKAEQSKHLNHWTSKAGESDRSQSWRHAWKQTWPGATRLLHPVHTRPSIQVWRCKFPLREVPSRQFEVHHYVSELLLKRCLKHWGDTLNAKLTLARVTCWVNSSMKPTIGFVKFVYLW